MKIRQYNFLVSLAIIITFFVGIALIIGLMYLCYIEAMDKKDQCQNGDMSACVEYQWYLRGK